MLVSRYSVKNSSKLEVRLEVKGFWTGRGRSTTRRREWQRLRFGSNRERTRSFHLDRAGRSGRVIEEDAPRLLDGLWRRLGPGMGARHHSFRGAAFDPRALVLDDARGSTREHQLLPDQDCGNDRSAGLPRSRFQVLGNDSLGREEPPNPSGPALRTHRVFYITLAHVSLLP